jgi:hypothetical protein
MSKVLTTGLLVLLTATAVPHVLLSARFALLGAVMLLWSMQWSGPNWFGVLMLLTPVVIGGLVVYTNYYAWRRIQLGQAVSAVALCAVITALAASTYGYVYATSGPNERRAMFRIGDASADRVLPPLIARTKLGRADAAWPFVEADT